MEEKNPHKVVSATQDWKTGDQVKFFHQNQFLWILWRFFFRLKMYENEKPIIDAVINVTDLHVRTRFIFQKNVRIIKHSGRKTGSILYESKTGINLFPSWSIGWRASLYLQKFTRLPGPPWAWDAMKSQKSRNVETVRGELCKIFLSCREKKENKFVGEDYTGEVYEGYIPGVLDELLREGIFPVILQTFTIDKVWEPHKGVSSIHIYIYTTPTTNIQCIY